MLFLINFEHISNDFQITFQPDTSTAVQNLFEISGVGLNNWLDEIGSIVDSMNMMKVNFLNP